MAKEVYEVVFQSFELKTVSDYVNEPGSPAKEYIHKEEEFLKVQNKQGKTNKEAILEKHRFQNKKNNFEKLPAGQIPIKVGTVLAIPVNKVDKLGLLTEGIEVVSNDIPAFKARALAELETKEGYNPVRKTALSDKNKGVLVESYPEATIWIWCRALSDSQLKEENKGVLFNVTPFIQKISTNVGKNGGNFQLTLAPVICELNEQNEWILKKESIYPYEKNSQRRTQQNDGFVAYSNLLVKDKQGNTRVNSFLFHNIISANDLVFIRFETLDLEKDQRIDDNKGFVIDKDKIPNRIYDMIGLVDFNTEVINGENNDVSVNIQGRDLSKLFIEDGTYFYALEMTNGQLNFAGGSTQQNEYMQRVISSNSLQYFQLYYNNSIEKIFSFVIQQLSTIKIVPNSLFEAYKERRNKKYGSQKERAIVSELENIKQEGVQAISNLRKQVELTNAVQQEENRQIEFVWNELVRFFQYLRNNKSIRKVKGSQTVGWKAFSYTNNRGVKENIKENVLPSFFAPNMHLTLFYTKNPYFKKGEDVLFKAIDKYVDLLPTSVKKDKEVWTEDFANGIWQIVKLVIDQGITNRRVVDSSASSANGSLLNFIKKVCQEPFVEFYMDTYGDMYHLIARKPPTDKEGLLSMLEGGLVNVDKEDGKSSQIQTSTVIDIEVEDVLQEQLSYADQGAVSWYHLTPQGSFVGSGSTYSLAYLPAIFFREYAEIWGSRPLQIVHNYMPRLPLNAQKSELLDISEKQAFEDMRYLVQSNAYIPFTRSGTITLNGDRRLKIGNICRYKPTGEIFFIDEVQQAFSVGENSIDRTTTIHVSRGMIESFIRGVDVEENGKKFKVGYFDIIGDKLDLSTKEVVETITEQVKIGTRRVSKNITPTAQTFYNNNSINPFNNIDIKRIDELFSATNSFKGYKYGLGSDGKGKAIDCSGFVSAVLRMCGSSVGGTSEQLMKISHNFRKVFPGFLQASMLQEGDVVGLDTGIYDYDFYRSLGIDHIAIVVKNYVTGKLELAESVSGVGFRSTPLEKIIPHYNKISKMLYVGDFRGDRVLQDSRAIEEDVPVYKTRTRKEKRREVDRSKVFSNFQVNIECFNFLIRRRQNALKYKEKR